MTAMPMQGDGPRVHEDDPPYTLADMIATSDDNFDMIGAVCFSRRWNDERPRWQLSAWQQVGPEMLWAVNRQTAVDLPRIGPLVTSYVCGLTWVVRKKLSRMQVESAVYDAFCRVVWDDCMPADVSAMMVACRKETFLELRAEAAAMMVFAMGMAAANVRLDSGN